MSLFKYAGVDFDTLGLSVEQADGLKSAPPVRGANLLIPYQAGKRWVQKYPDERVVVLQGRVVAATGVLLESYVDQLKALIGTGEQKLEVQQLDTTWRYIMAEAKNVLIPTIGQGYPQSTKWSLELVASDPFWYGSVLEGQVPRSAWTLDSGVFFDDGAHWFDVEFTYFAQTIVGSPAAIEASNGGNYYNRKPVFFLTGTLVNPKIVNAANGYSLQIPGSFSSLTIDCGAQLVNGVSWPVTLGAGQTDWMRLQPGDNTLTITGAAGAAYQAQYSPAYL